MKFFIKDFFGKCDQIRSYLQIWSHLLKKSLMENFIFRAVKKFHISRWFKLEVKKWLLQLKVFGCFFFNFFWWNFP